MHIHIKKKKKTELFKPPELHTLIQIGPLRRKQPAYKYEQQITACTCKSANGQSSIKTLGFKFAVIYSHCGKGGEAGVQTVSNSGKNLLGRNSGSEICYI